MKVTQLETAIAYLSENNEEREEEAAELQSELETYEDSYAKLQQEIALNMEAAAAQKEPESKEGFFEVFMNDPVLALESADQEELAVLGIGAAAALCCGSLLWVLSCLCCSRRRKDLSLEAWAHLDKSAQEKIVEDLLEAGVFRIKGGARNSPKSVSESPVNRAFESRLRDDPVGDSEEEHEDDGLLHSDAHAAAFVTLSDSIVTSNADEEWGVDPVSVSIRVEEDSDEETRTITDAPERRTKSLPSVGMSGAAENLRVERRNSSWAGERDGDESPLLERGEPGMRAELRKWHMHSLLTPTARSK
jgi:hypothetical protein